MSDRANYRFEEHTGELQIGLEASSLAELFVAAGRALGEIMGGPSGPSGPAVPPATGPRQEITLEAPDRDALLVDWLNELIFRAERDKVVFDDIRIARITDRELVASVGGREPSALRTPVKAATFHGLRIAETPEGYAASVVLDV